MSTESVLDEYGNNAAIRCPACHEVFLFSKHLNKASGRECPHCHKAKASLSEGEIEVRLIGEDGNGLGR
jgi:Zn finger protein HypA/HybF involved in hydrogenase expression